MKTYSVTLNMTHEYLVDMKGLIKWAKENMNLDPQQYNENWIIFEREEELTPINGEGMENYKSQEHYDLEQHYLSLTEEGEEVKLTLPSRLQGQELQQWEAAKKAEIATITNYSSLSEAQKKLWMGLPLTDEEKDGLGA